MLNQHLSFCTHLDISKMANMYRWSLHLHSKNCDCADRRTVTLKQLMFWRNGKPTSIGTQPSKNCDTLVGTVHPKDSLSVALQLWKPSDVGRTWAQRSITMNRAEVHDQFHFMSKKMEKCHTVYEQLNNWYILKATSHSYRLWQKSNPPTIQGLIFSSLVSSVHLVSPIFFVCVQSHALLIAHSPKKLNRIPWSFSINHIFIFWGSPFPWVLCPKNQGSNAETIRKCASRVSLSAPPMYLMSRGPAVADWRNQV